MQLLRTESPRCGTLSEPSQTRPAPARTAAQTAAKWVGMALDPRGAAKLLGRTTAMVTTLALQARGTAASTCYASHAFKSVDTHANYAVRAACNEDRAYFHRMLDKCHVVATEAGNPQNWHQIANWGNTLLWRELASVLPGDEALEACLEREGHAQSRVIPRRAGIIAGSVIGGVLVGALAIYGLSRCCKARPPAPRRDVEMGPAPAPAPTV